jgi:hypothetical protein
MNPKEKSEKNKPKKKTRIYYIDVPLLYQYGITKFTPKDKYKT